jgi:hypothetical protein
MFGDFDSEVSGSLFDYGIYPAHYWLLAVESQKARTLPLPLFRPATLVLRFPNSSW